MFYAKTFAKMLPKMLQNILAGLNTAIEDRQWLHVNFVK